MYKFSIYVGLIDDWIHRPSNRRAANVVAAHIYLYYDSKQAIFEIEQFCLRCTEKAPLKKIGLAPKSSPVQSNNWHSDITITRILSQSLTREKAT